MLYITMLQTEDILRFLPIFRKEGFVFSTIHPAIQKDGFWAPAYNELSETALDFIQVLYSSGAIDTKFLNETTVSIARSYQLRNDNDAIMSASLFEIGHVLTFLMRAERFTPGTITAAYNSGLLTRTLERFSAISKS